MSELKKIYAEEVNYWKTGQSAPDTLIAKAKREIEHPAVGGRVTGEAFVNFDSKSAYVLTFKVGMDNYRVVWPILQTRTSDETASRRQAATFLYHDVKAKCMVAKIRGPRVGFVGDLVLPDGRTVTEAAAPETISDLPRLLAAPVNENYIDGEIAE